MVTFENLYDKKDNAAFVSANLSRYLTAEIYSPVVIRMAYARWREMPFYAREGVHVEMRKILEESPSLSNGELQKKINAHLIVRGIKILVAYSHCPVPLTQDRTIPVRHENFLSNRGKGALKALLHTATRGKFTYEMADLAIRTSHKFLMDLGYYRNLINSESADVLTFSVHNKNKDMHLFYPPIVQLSQGCPNHCSHCFASAENHLSYMPYPMWRKIYETLNGRYQYYHGDAYQYGHSKLLSWIPGVNKRVTLNYVPFARFFHDSDPSIYHDSIINVDAGDIALLLREKEADYYFLTKGITNPVSRRAIAKTALAYPISISFVDTPKESKVHSMTQFRKTLNLVESVPHSQGIQNIHLLYLKSGPSVCEDIFKGYNLIKELILPCGRANQFPTSELDMTQTEDLYPFTINPNGDIVLPKCENTRYIQDKIKNIFSRVRE